MLGVIIALFVLGWKIAVNDVPAYTALSFIANFLFNWYFVWTIIWVVVCMIFFILGVVKHGGFIVAGLVLVVKAAILQALFFMATHILSLGASQENNLKLIIALSMFLVACIIQMAWSMKVHVKN